MIVAATAFIDDYLDALRTLQPREVGRAPCFGYGRGGIAYTLLKAGRLRADPALVRAARKWAAAGIRSGQTYHMRGWPKTSFGRGLPGLHAIHALAAHAEDDPVACRRELQRFVATARRGRGTVELFRGMAGRLAGAAIVLRRIPDPDVRALGDDLAARIMSVLEELATRGARGAPLPPLEPPGLAHGWAGVVLAALSWHDVTRSLPEAALRRAVLVARREAAASRDPRWGDWAHGDAGSALLFARAYLLLGDRRFLGWARKAAAVAQTWPSRVLALTNGAPGVAYSLLAVAAADPAGPWRDTAWAIAGQILSYVDVPERTPYGMWSGLGGICCLLLDLVHETPAGFPGVEA